MPLQGMLTVAAEACPGHLPAARHGVLAADNCRTCIDTVLRGAYLSFAAFGAPITEEQAFSLPHLLDPTCRRRRASLEIRDYFYRRPHRRLAVPVPARHSASMACAAVFPMHMPWPFDSCSRVTVARQPPAGRRQQEREPRSVSAARSPSRSVLRRQRSLHRQLSDW